MLIYVIGQIGNCVCTDSLRSKVPRYVRIVGTGTGVASFSVPPAAVDLPRATTICLDKLPNPRVKYATNRVKFWRSQRLECVELA